MLDNVIGQSKARTDVLAGQYNNKALLEAAFLRIDDTGSKESPLVISIVNIIGGGEEEWSVEELQVLGVYRNGMSIRLPHRHMFFRLSLKAMMLILCGFAGLMFDERYAWATRWKEGGWLSKLEHTWTRCS